VGELVDLLDSLNTEPLVNMKYGALVATIGFWMAFGTVGTKAPWNAHEGTYAAPMLSDLKSVDELKTLFNQDRGKPRLVLLLSPT
jgi:hypothetical protein